MKSIRNQNLSKKNHSKNTEKNKSQILFDFFSQLFLVYHLLHLETIFLDLSALINLATKYKCIASKRETIELRFKNMLTGTQFSLNCTIYFITFYLLKAETKLLTWFHNNISKHFVNRLEHLIPLILRSNGFHKAFKEIEKPFVVNLKSQNEK